MHIGLKVTVVFNFRCWETTWTVLNTLSWISWITILKTFLKNIQSCTSKWEVKQAVILNREGIRVTWNIQEDVLKLYFKTSLKLVQIFVFPLIGVKLGCGKVGLPHICHSALNHAGWLQPDFHNRTLDCFRDGGPKVSTSWWCWTTLLSCCASNSLISAHFT